MLQTAGGIYPPSTLVFSWQETLGDSQKRLAQRLLEEFKGKEVTKQDLEHLDAVFWRYKKFMPWHAAACTGIRRILTYDPAIKTACVGWLKGQICMAINADFFFQLPLIQQVFILAHETEHVVRSHTTTMKEWPNLQKPLNFTMDALINTSLVLNNKHFQAEKNEVPPMPDGLVTWERFESAVKNQPKDASKRGVPWPNPGPDSFIHDFIAEKLLKYLPKGRDEDDNQQGADGGGGGQDDQQGSGQGQSQGQGSPQNGSGSGDGSGQDVFEIMDDLYGEGGEFFDDESTPEEMKQAIVKNILDEAEKSVGRGPGYLQSYCDRIRDKKNRNWRMAIRGSGWSTKTAITQSWSKVNKRFPWRRPGKWIFTRPPVLLVIDRSGSVGPSESVAFIMEVNGIVQWCDMDVIFVDDGWDPTNPDTYIKGINKLEPWKWWKDMGGGTHFKDVYKYLMEGEGAGKYETVILLTDGWLADSPRIPGRLARHNVLILTPDHDQRMYDEAKALGYQVYIIDDEQRRQAQEIRSQF